MNAALERVVTGAILANLAVLVVSWVDVADEQMWECAHDALLVFFATETGLRVHRLGWRPRRILRDRWLVFDAAIVVVALLPLAGSGMAFARTARLAHTVRHVGHLTPQLRLARLALR